MASITDIGTLTNPLSAPEFGGPSGWAAAVRDVLNSSDVTVDTRIANHAAAADPHPNYLQTAEADARYVELSGDTLTGPLTLAADPTLALGAATKQYVDASIPAGTIAMYASDTPPAGWAVCDGTAHGSAALTTILGSANTPDLRDRFIVGASPTKAVKSTGGADTVTLSAAQSGLVGHSHTGSSGTESADHSHSGTTGTMNSNWSHAHSGWSDWKDRAAAHSHSASINEGITTGDSTAYIDTADNDAAVGEVYAVTVYATDTNHLHGIGVGATDTNHTHGFTSGGRSAAHTHAITVAAAAAAAATTAHENKPPYYALVFIIKK
jgi:microcystin-dependent protein